MDIVVNDTNILIDLYSIDLLEYFFQLPIAIHTVDLVIHEIQDEAQRDSLKPYINRGILYVHKFSSEELAQAIAMRQEASGNVSVTDCSVWYYAKQHDYILLTGDRQLRVRAIGSNVAVKGIIFVFDLMVEHRLITPTFAADKLEELYHINQRLPKKIIQERLDSWRSNFSAQ
jgi:predicted nucleic acid-binding protein